MGQTKYLISVKVFNEANGEPICLDYGFGWLDRLEETANEGLVGVDIYGRPLMELIEGLGLTLKAYPSVRDTQKIHWTCTPGTSWFEWKPDVNQRVKWLAFTDNTPGIQPTAVSTYTHPANPHFTWSLVIPASSGDWDFNTLVPFTRLEFGNGWAIHVERSGAYLMRMDGRTWNLAIKIDNISKDSGGGSLDELCFMVRCQDGKIAISGDMGQNWTVYALANGAAIKVSGGKYTVRHRGGHLYMNVANIEYPSTQAIYLSPSRNNAFKRLFANPTISYRGWDPNSFIAGGSPTIAVTDRSDFTNAISRWQVIINRVVQAGVPFSFQSAGNLGSVTYRLNPILGALGNAHSFPWDGKVYRTVVSKPYDLAGATASVSFKLPLSTDFFEQSWFHRKIQISMGERHLDNNGATIDEDWYVVFTGYIYRVEYDETLSNFDITITCGNASHRFRTRDWTAFEIVSLSEFNTTVNQAADYILATEGWAPNSSYRTWHVNGNRRLTKGTYKSPTHLVRRGNSKWRDLEELFSFAELEVATSDDGTLVSLPRDYETGVTHEYNARNPDSIKKLLEDNKGRLDYSGMRTAVIAYGKNPAGQDIFGYIVDTPAETSTLSGRFAPWRVVDQIELNEVCDMGMLAARVNDRARETFNNSSEASFRFPVNLAVGRRDRIAVYGSSEFPDGTEFQVRTLTHTYALSQETGQYDISTIAEGIRKT
jgi:hypothetical protein